jgi:NADH-quinone oxidoreductase subunit L
MQTTTLIWLIPFPPLLAFALIVLFTNRRNALSHSLAIWAAVLSFLGSMIVVARALALPDFGKQVFESSVSWFPTGQTYFKIGVLVDPLTAATLFFVAWTVLMIFIYSVGYHNFGQPRGDHDRKGLQPHGAPVTDEKGHTHRTLSIEPMYARFFAFIALFAFGMYVLVVSNNFLTLFVGWEIMGLCSYLLIGFWFAKPSARAAAIKAFMTTRVGDVFMLLGIAYLYFFTGTLNYREIFNNPQILEQLTNTSAPFLGLSVAGLVALLLFIGTVGKSAQWPLHVWLPDAMEGPTPVSAMIHAATMVSAGVYLVIRIYPLVAAGWHEGLPLNPTMSIIAFIGAFSALFAATIAVAQNDIKRVLAYSTISQLGYMIAALGMGAYVAATFHLLTHAFFKALLFLGSGSVIHGVEHGALHTGDHADPQDMFNMGGLRKKMPITFATFLIGGLALSGFPLVTAGFWSKDEILAHAFENGHWAVFAALALAALLTAFYTMRQITLTFFGEPRSKAAEQAHETPRTMTWPLVILAVFAIGIGWLGIPEGLTGGLIPNFFQSFVGATLVEEPEALAFNAVPMLVSIAVALTGLGLGYFVYRKQTAGQKDPLEVALPGFIYTTLKRKYYFDEFYNFFIIRPVWWLSETFSYLIVDRTVIDGALHAIGFAAQWIGRSIRQYFDAPFINRFIGDGSAAVTQWSGQKLKLSQPGQVQSYLVGSLVVIIILAGIFAYFLLA